MVSVGSDGDPAASIYVAIGGGSAENAHAPESLLVQDETIAAVQLSMTAVEEVLHEVGVSTAASAVGTVEAPGKVRAMIPPNSGSVVHKSRFVVLLLSGLLSEVGWS